MKLVSAILGILFLSSCTHRAINNVNYSKHNAHTTSKAIGSSYKELTHITVSESDFVFGSCETLAEIALADLIKKAKEQGGNAIVDVWWTTHHDLKTSTPTCAVRWGWFAAYVVGGLGPWVKNVEVSATVAYVDALKEPIQINVFYIDPNSSNKQNANAFWKKLNSSSNLIGKK